MGLILVAFICGPSRYADISVPSETPVAVLPQVQQRYYDFYWPEYSITIDFNPELSSIFPWLVRIGHDPTPASRSSAILRGEPSASVPSSPSFAMSQDSVSIYVASLCSAYHDGVELIQYIKTKRDSRKASRDASMSASALELESSLRHGENAVRNQYVLTYERCGGAFAQGDRTFPGHRQ